jgi:hypothetical protein
VPNGHDPVRLVRVGGPITRGTESGSAPAELGIVAVSGPNAWIWKSGAFHVIDMHAW